MVIALAIAIPAVLISSGGPAPPATGAASVVPADALAYVHLSIDSGRAPVAQAAALDRRLPGFYSLTSSVTGRLDAILGGGATLDYARDVRPWIGKEAALALLDTTSSTAGSLIVLDVRDRPAAQALLRRTGATAAGTYRGIAIEGYPTGTELAFVKHYLVLGQDASVRSAIDVATSSAPSLAGTPAYDEAATGEPADRVLDAYVSAAGERRVLASATGPLGALGALLSQPATTATTISVVARVRRAAGLGARSAFRRPGEADRHAAAVRPQAAGSAAERVDAAGRRGASRYGRAADPRRARIARNRQSGATAAQPPG